MTKHTPGPWEVREGEDYHEILMGSALGPRGSHEPQHCIEYEHCLYEDDGGQYEEAEANARLISAAPDLLEACKAALSALDAQAHLGEPIRGIGQDEIDMMRDAVHKATLEATA